MTKPTNKKHVPIMVKEILAHMPDTVHTVFDGTIGHGGHSQEILDHYPQCRIIGCDRDRSMLEKAENYIQVPVDWSVVYVHDSYANIQTIADAAGVASFDMMLLDIGINRGHIADPERGFSIKAEGPLDMRFDQTQGKTLQQHLQHRKPDKLKQWMIDFGDFSQARAEQIAYHLIQASAKETITTTLKLKQVLAEIGINEKKSAVVFQVLRIMVNEELQQLEIFLDQYYQYLRSWARCFIITFHSVEDRIVKQAFKLQEDKSIIKRVNKKVIIPSRQEQQANRASRSAKLRIVERI